MSVNQLPDEVRKQRAKELLNQGRIEEAHQVLAELCRDEQGDIEIWSLYSTACGHLRRYEDVIRACHKMMAIEPDHLPALNSLASALAALQRFDEASEQFARLLELAPDNPAILNNYGLSLTLMGRYVEARRALEKTVGVQPYYAEAHFNLALLLEQSGHPEEALREYEQAAALKPALPGLDERLQKLRGLARHKF